MRQLFVVLTILSGLVSPKLVAAPASLAELLELVKEGHRTERKIAAEREKRFKQQHDKQQQLLAAAKKDVIKEEARSTTLRMQYEKNQRLLEQQDVMLEKNMGALGELHNIVRQLASDINIIFNTSLVSAQKKGRTTIIDQLANSETLPAIQQLEALWVLITEELVESGEVVTFSAPIVTVNGVQAMKDVVRVGTFNMLSDGHYLRYLPETGQLVEPSRQPAFRVQAMAKQFENGQGLLPLPIDPTRGAMLDLLVQAPDLKTRINQGSIVGYIIIVIGLIGLLIAAERLIMLHYTGRKVRQQLTQRQAKNNNPLGRIMKVSQENAGLDPETLGLKLDEAILKELPDIQKRLGALALLAAIAPLLGLLGTVTGIIETFNSITLYGATDPRLMSGGISQALITTAMGLLTAIPLLLLHSFLSMKSNQLIHILDEKSLSFIASLSEQKKQHV